VGRDKGGSANGGDEPPAGQGGYNDARVGDGVVVVVVVVVVVEAHDTDHAIDAPTASTMAHPTVFMVRTIPCSPTTTPAPAAWNSSSTTVGGGAGKEPPEAQQAVVINDAVVFTSAC
jgi:hypothetical protein